MIVHNRLESFATLLLSIVVIGHVSAFAPLLDTRSRKAAFVVTTPRYAGGFEWEDPGQAFDQGVENPFKNPELMNTEEGMKIDAARLLGPRLGGSNLYFIGMMGCGKSAVGNIVARREFWHCRKLEFLISLLAERCASY